MPIPDDDILDNQKRTVASYLNEVLATNPSSNFDIATAFFEVGAYSLLKDNLGKVKHFRLLLGKSPEFHIDTTLGQELERLLKEEVEGFDLTQDNQTAVQQLIKYLKQDKVEVKLYDQNFLHGKAYIFENLVVIGSSNFTAAGLTHNGELNTVQLKGQSKYVREEWFEKFWADARDYKQQLIDILEKSRFGTIEYTPYQVFIKALYELQKQDIAEDENKERDADSLVDLTEFQADAITRIKTRMNKYGSVLIADSVGLGKTKIAAKIVEEIGFFKRKKFLVVCPAQLREMWREELKKLNMSEPILSLEDLGTSDYLEKAKRATGGKLDNIELVVVDESHNLRNPFSNRWENFFSLIHDHVSNKGKQPFLLFLTATPINNSIWDLYHQLELLVGGNDSAFAGDNIPSLLEYFKNAHKQNDPNLLNDLLNEISVRRTRDYIIKNYPKAYITVDGKPVEIKFPKRRLENVNYKLDASYQGLYKEISSVISKGLTMAYYKLFDYHRNPESVNILYKGRMIALEGIFRTIMLKRLESSVQAFRISISSHVNFLEKLKASLKQGKLLTKDLYRKYLDDLEDQTDLEESSPELFAKQLKLIKELEDFKLEDYDKDRLFKDIDHDIRLLKTVHLKVSRIDADQDSKLITFKEKLLGYAGKGQVVVFTYYADTLNYIFQNVASDPAFKRFKIEKISGAIPAKQREELKEQFRKKEIDVIMSTDVLSEGQNLQSAQYCVNYDLHWNPTRMIQRAGRIDRIGSPYDEIYIYNFFPEDELEELLKLVNKLQNKIIQIDASIGLDQSILGEEIHPKVFGIIKRIHERDESLLDELEAGMFGGGERFYQPLKDFVKKSGRELIENIPFGVYSGLKKKNARAIFFYYQYDKTFHYWLLYDPETKELIAENKSQILSFIECKPDEKRVIPDYFEAVFSCSKKATQRIEDSYKKLEFNANHQVGISHLSKHKPAKFVIQLIKDVDLAVDQHLIDYPADHATEDAWVKIKEKIQNLPLPGKKRLSLLRKIAREFKQNKNWKAAIKQLDEFVAGKQEVHGQEIKKFDPKKLKLVAVDFIS